VHGLYLMANRLEELEREIARMKAESAKVEERLEAERERWRDDQKVEIASEVKREVARQLGLLKQRSAPHCITDPASLTGIKNLADLAASSGASVEELLQLTRSDPVVELQGLMDERGITGLLDRKRIANEHQALLAWTGTGGTHSATGIARFSQFAAESYSTGEGGGLLTATGEPQGRACLCSASPMLQGNDVSFVEVELIEVEHGAYIGVARPWLDCERPYAYGGEELWAVGLGGSIWHAYDVTKRCIDWQGMQEFTKGDTVGLLLDCGAGSLTIYKNRVRLGVGLSGLKVGRQGLVWAVALGDHGDRVRISEKPPPV
jgi:hypothetical protein